MPRTSPYPTAEGCQALALDINPVMRRVKEARRAGTRVVGVRRSWTTAGESKPWAWVDILVEAGPDYADAVLRYDITHISRPTGPQVQRVAIAAEPCHFGGVRWFWVCPTTGRRVRLLFLPNGGTRFLSRAAYKLRWLSTCSTPLAKSHMRLAKLARRLRAEYREFTPAPPPKPPKMPQHIYDRVAAA